MAIEFSSLASGSSGNCQYIKSKDTQILVDAGLSGKYIKNALSHYGVLPEDIDGIIVTHEHSDHIKGLGIMHRAADIPIYITEKTWQVSKGQLGKINPSKLHIIQNDTPFTINDLCVSPHPISHDAVDPVCYKLSDGQSDIAVVTDLGYFSEALYDFLRRASLVLLEANHNEKMLMEGPYSYPLKQRVISDLGHLSNMACGDAANRLISSGALTHLLLGHPSKDNNTPQVAYRDVTQTLGKEGIKDGADVIIDMTYRQHIGNLYRIGR